VIDAFAIIVSCLGLAVVVVRALAADAREPWFPESPPLSNSPPPPRRRPRRR